MLILLKNIQVSGHVELLVVVPLLSFKILDKRADKVIDW